MAKINSFEDLKVWQIAREFAKEIYELSNKGNFAKYFSRKDQINKSAGSTMDNVAEGFERGGKKEFIQFFFIAKGSSGETRSQLYPAFDKGYLTAVELESLKDKVITISKQLSGFIGYLKKSEMKGSKYVHEPEEVYNIIEDLNLEF